MVAAFRLKHLDCLTVKCLSMAGMRTDNLLAYWLSEFAGSTSELVVTPSADRLSEGPCSPGHTGRTPARQ